MRFLVGLHIMPADKGMRQSINRNPKRYYVPVCPQCSGVVWDQLPRLRFETGIKVYNCFRDEASMPSRCFGSLDGASPQKKNKMKRYCRLKAIQKIGVPSVTTVKYGTSSVGGVAELLD